MPKYPTRCKSCEHEFEVTKKITDNSPTACTECGSEDTHTMMSKLGKQSVVDNTRWRKGEYGQNDKR
jgi:putative FmdB family regulatory protein